MCSLTWLRRADGYELFFNRDELRSRKAGLPPAEHRLRGVRYLAPTDADAGGTWIGVNERGITVAVMNGYSPPGAPPPGRSRGLLVADLMDAGSVAEVERGVRAGGTLAPYRPFVLVAFEPPRGLSGARGEGPGVLAAAWDGAALSVRRLAPGDQPLSSSSRDPAGAERNRAQVFAALARGLSDEALHLAFHASHAPEPGALSACMHRDDAETVSFARARVGAGRVELGYSPQAPCRRVPLAWMALERAAPRGAAVG